VDDVIPLQYVGNTIQLQYVDVIQLQYVYVIQLEYVDVIQLQYVDNMTQLQYVNNITKLQYMDDMLQLQCVDDLIHLQFATNLSFWQPFPSLALQLFSLALTTLTTIPHSVLSKPLFSIMLHPYSSKPIRQLPSILLNLGLPFSLLLVSPSLKLSLSLYHPLLQHSQPFPIYVP
jgi:hypothetical protein